MIVSKVKKKKKFPDSSFSCERFVSISPLRYSTDSGTLSGCFIRLATQSTTEVNYTK